MPATANVQIEAGKRLFVTVRNADNQVAVYVNGQEAYKRATENDPTFNDVVDLSPFLHPGENLVQILGINWGGPYHNSVQVRIDGQVIGDWNDSRPNTPNGIVDSKYFIVRA